MKRLAFSVMGVVLSCASAEAGICSSPQELKLLKAAVLEQELAAAAQSCRLSADFDRFVAAYHGGMVNSDRALKVFFAGRKNGEGYEGYKSRIASEVAQRSLHDPQFCSYAKRVFDIALKRSDETPVNLVATGYEDCRAPQPISAALIPVRRPQNPSVRIASDPAALHSLQVAVAIPTPRPALKQTPHPVSVAVEKPALRAAPQVASQAPLRLLSPLHVIDAPESKASHPHSAQPVMPVSTQDDDTPYRANDPVPNAYKPGAMWVVTSGRSGEASERRVQGPDGQWYVLVGSKDPWAKN